MAKKWRGVTLLCVVTLVVVWALFYRSNITGSADREEPKAQIVGEKSQYQRTETETAIVTEPVALTARIVTSHGDLVLELLPEAAPKTVENFLRLARTGWYNGTTLYRFEKNFCLQGGGWPKKSSPFPSVKLEYKLPNQKYAVSMARTADPNSATSEFSIMLNDNSQWLGPGGSDPHGYAVFAQVTKGYDVIDRLGQLPTKKQGLTLFQTPVAISTVIIEQA